MRSIGIIVGGVILMAITAGSVALQDDDAETVPPGSRVTGWTEYAQTSDDAPNGPWFRTLREAVIHRAAKDGIVGDALYVGFIPDGLGPPDRSRRPAISDGATFCTMYSSTWDSDHGWRLGDERGFGCDPFDRDVEPRHPNGQVMEMP